MKSNVVKITGLVLAVWMAAGRWAFGLGGDLTLWFVPAIGIPYALLSWWIGHRVALTGSRGLSTGRAMWVAIAISWVMAIGFGFTVPDRANGELASIVSHAAGSQFSAEMSIALCNPMGIISFATAFIALGFAIASGRERQPEEDELLYDGSAPDERGMVPHPLAK